MAHPINLKVYHGVEASVNAYIFFDNKSIILVDCLRNSNEAAKLAQQIKAENKPLTHVLITHGHPDHCIGMNVIKKEFPNAQIVVTTPAIKNDIMGFSAWMESVGWLDGEPALKPQSAANPDGFDYEKHINVLNASQITLADGAVLQLNSDYNAAECEHLTTIFSEDLNAFFANDFIYNGVHPWLAVDKQHIANWKKQLQEFNSAFADSNPTVYPGHGKPSDASVFAVMLKYITDFEQTVATSTSRAEAMQKMQQLYPNHAQADFLLVYSVNAFVEE